MISRRDLMRAAGAAAILGARAVGAQTRESAAVQPGEPAAAQTRESDAAQPREPDYKIEIAPATLDLSPRQRLKTITYNGQVPGPLLRFKEGREVTIEVTNRSDTPEVVHWHGLFLPASVDGATEEGTPAIAPNATARYTFTPRPAGFRWYHTHTMAMGDLTRAQYGGQHGFLMVEPRDDPARYDQEFFLALHDWDGHLLSSDDGAMNPVYNVSTINSRTLGFGEPLRVTEGQRILLHILNSSPTETHWVALAGHALRVVALDGNPVPTSRQVPMLRLAPAERVSAVVEMNNPGVWILGEVRKHIQAAGMGIVIEYANQSAKPRWQQPSDLLWNYERFAAAAPPSRTPGSDPPTVIPLVFESRFRGHGAMEAWTINGKSWPDVPSDPLRVGARYRLQLINRSQDDHPVHLHRHSFELHGRSVQGIVKDVIVAPARTTTEVEFTAANPGPTLFHCHQQNHMDLGFMMLFNYA